MYKMLESKILRKCEHQNVFQYKCTLKIILYIYDAMVYNLIHSLVYSKACIIIKETWFLIK